MIIQNVEYQPQIFGTPHPIPLPKIKWLMHKPNWNRFLAICVTWWRKGSQKQKKTACPFFLLAMYIYYFPFYPVNHRHRWSFSITRKTNWVKKIFFLTKKILSKKNCYSKKSWFLLVFPWFFFLKKNIKFGVFWG